MDVLNQKTLQTIQNNILSYIEKWGPTERVSTTKVATIGLSSVAAYYFCKNIVYNLYIHPVNKIPGPRVSWIPFMGNFFEVMRSEIDSTPFIEWSEKYGGIFSYHFYWNEPRLVVTDHKLVKQILTSQVYDFRKPYSASKTLARVLGDGLLVAEGEAHRQQRKMLNPAFSVQAVREMVPLMLDPAYTLRNQWIQKIAESSSEYTEIEVSKGLSLATLDVIGITAFGQDFKSLSENMSRLGKAYLQIFSIQPSFLQIISIAIPILKYIPTKKYKDDAMCLKWLREESEKLVDAGIKRSLKKDSEDNERHKNLLSLMVNLIDEETGKGFTREELRNQCLTFLAAGHETTSNTLSWCLWLLARNQEVQDKLRSEIQVLFKDNKIADYDAINSLPYLDQVFRETLRVIPTVPRTIRVNSVPVTLGPHVIPKNTIFHIAPIVSHLSKDIWGEDAHEFKPSRWEKSKEIGNAYQFFPFLVGGRQCIGHKFATVELKVLLSILLKDIQFFEKPGFTIAKKQFITTHPIPNMTLWTKPVAK